MNVFEDTYLADILHVIAQGLLVPTMVCIVVLIAVTLFLLGHLVAEVFTERRGYKQNMPAIVNAITDANYQDIVDIVEKSKLLRYQKAALVVVARNMGLAEEPLFALAQIQVVKVERLFSRRMAWTDTISKIAPLLGLMGTLIPLGPGIVSLGQGDTLGLSQSLLVAFDATVCGLVCAIVALIVSKIRSGWYGECISSLESIMSCVVDKAAEARKDGVVLSAGYSGDPLAEYAAMDKKAKRQKKGQENSLPNAKGTGWQGRGEN